MKIFKKYYDSHDKYQGIYILKFKIRSFDFNWFTDCGDWFIIFHWINKKQEKIIRFSSAGYINHVVNRFR